MKKLFTDHVSLWILLLIGIAVAALTLAVVNSQRLKNAKSCQCQKPTVPPAGSVTGTESGTATPTESGTGGE